MRNTVIALAFGSACMAAPAHAQSDFWAGVTADVIGQTVAGSMSGPDYTRCMQGRTRISQRALRRIQASAQSAMNGYVAVSSHQDAANVTPFYVTPSKPGQLLLNGEQADPSAFADPIADVFAGGRPAGDPAQFIAGGDGLSAAGIWAVHNAEGEVLGHYRGIFAMQQRGVFRLTSLEVLTGAERGEELAPFCHAPGDVQPVTATGVERDEADAAPMVEAASAPAAESAPAEAPPAE
jgi:hypothetical protein